MNAILAAAGYNLRIILKKLRLAWLRFLHLLLRDLGVAVPAGAAA